MTLFDLFFLISVLFALAMAVRIAISAIRRQWPTAARRTRMLALFLALYAGVLICVALVLPRRFYAPGERRCFDDWCAAAVSIAPVENPTESPCGPGNGGRDWVATIEVASEARRVRQRAAGASAQLEDERGARYWPCAAAASGRSLTDVLDPGESFRVSLPFRLPSAATPAGMVVHHGDFPGVVIIGADQSLFHALALQRLSVEQGK
jgi:hypothetical protein